MIIHVYTVCWNAEKIIPYFLRHYLTFSDKIIVYDNYSDDKTGSIACSFEEVELRKLDTNGEFNDAVMNDIKNTAYKESRGIADYVLVVDIDEFVYHPELTALLRKYKQDGITLPKVAGYNMVSYCFPTTSQQIYAQIRYGEFSTGYSKRCIFDPNIDINYSPGGHECRPKGIIKESENAELKLFHYHYVGLITNFRKHRACKKRLSQFNIDHNAGWQFGWNPIIVSAKFLAIHANSQDVITGKRSIFSVIGGPLISYLKRKKAHRLHRF